MSLYRKPLLTIDTIDDFWLQQAPEYKGKKFKSVTKGDINLGDDKTENTEAPEDEKILIERLKEILSEEIEDVRVSKRLTDSPVCLVASNDGLDMHMERVLKIHQKYAGNSKPVLGSCIWGTWRILCLATGTRRRFFSPSAFGFLQTNFSPHTAKYAGRARGPIRRGDRSRRSTLMKP